MGEWGLKKSCLAQKHRAHTSLRSNPIPGSGSNTRMSFSALIKTFGAKIVRTKVGVLTHISRVGSCRRQRYNDLIGERLAQEDSHSVRTGFVARISMIFSLKHNTLTQ